MTQTQKNIHGANGESSDDFYIYVCIYIYFLHCEVHLHKVIFYCKWTVPHPWTERLYLDAKHRAAGSLDSGGERHRKQSSSCFCLTSSDMAWPLHRSLLHTIGFLPKSRLCVWMCICVLCVLFPDMVFSCYQHAHNSPGLISKVFFQNSRFWCWYNVATEWKSYLHADVFCKKRRLIGIFTSIYPFYQKREQVCIYACQPQWQKASWIILQQTHTHGLVRTQTLPTRLILHSYTACKK